MRLDGSLGLTRRAPVATSVAGGSTGAARRSPAFRRRSAGGEVRLLHALSGSLGSPRPPKATTRLTEPMLQKPPRVTPGTAHVSYVRRRRTSSKAEL